MGVHKAYAFACARWSVSAMTRHMMIVLVATLLLSVLAPAGAATDKLVVNASEGDASASLIPCVSSLPCALACVLAEGPCSLN
jgi:hypothetical protein